MLISLRSCKVSARWLMSLALLACACGGDDKKTEASPTPDENEGGAPPVAPSYPPALSPQDCATTTSKITLTQPDGAAVWGGLVLLEFEVEGAKVDSFDVQSFDPALGGWTNYYLGREVQGQRDDGSYFLAVSPSFSEVTKDQQLKLRVRPTQDGCPEAAWTETPSFGAGDPLLGTHWTADISAADLNGQLSLTRVVDQTTSEVPVKLGDATLSVDFGKKGAFTQVLTVPLSTKKGEPYDGCTVSLTFSGSYSLSVRSPYGEIRLAISEQTLTSTKGTVCDFPTVDEMALSAEDFDLRLNAYTRQGISIDYLPTLFAEPGSPLWQNSNFGQIFQQLPQFLAYLKTTEYGSVSGYTNVQELRLERQ
jgi:hypothetical protein